MRATAIFGILYVVAAPCNAAAQTVPLTPGTVVEPGAISCAPSNNATGHVECLEYTKAGGLEAISWQSPPPYHGASPTGLEASEKIDRLTIKGVAGKPHGAPACASYDKGIVACLVISQTGSAFAVYGTAFYGPTALTTPTQDVGSIPAGSTVSNPSCASAKLTSNPSSPGVICALAINGSIYAVGLEIESDQIAASPLTKMGSLGAGFDGHPSCSTVAPGSAAACAVRRGHDALLGFSLRFTSASPLAVAAADVVTMESATIALSGNPACATPGDGDATGSPPRAICAVAAGPELYGVSFTPQPGNSKSSSFQIIGKVKDGGTWTGQVSCAPSNLTINLTSTITCAAISSTSKVTVFSFDPVTPILTNANTAYAVNTANTPSCIQLNIKLDDIFCGITTRNDVAEVATFLDGLEQPFFPLYCQGPLSTSNESIPTTPFKWASAGAGEASPGPGQCAWADRPPRDTEIKQGDRNTLYGALGTPTDLPAHEFWEIGVFRDPGVDNDLVVTQIVGIRNPPFLPQPVLPQ
jgi:hypothetical protein